ncbi:MAG: SDR family oxidoreductase [Gemmatimonadota bacterium]|nr:SDR family oxidoreductase [Gemmatimonadota bacterium]
MSAAHLSGADEGTVDGSAAHGSGANEGMVAGSASRSVLVTGAAGYVGGKLIRALGSGGWRPETVVATDVRLPPRGARLPGISYELCDVRDGGRLHALVARYGVDTVVHLASVVTPGRDGSTALAYEVDVVGTRNVLSACLTGGVGKLVITSSGAAYGYHHDNRPWLDEDDPIRGHDAMAYSRHKRLVEEMLAEARRDHPHLRQLVFRPGTILGTGVANPITDFFDKPMVFGVTGADSPFVFIWDEDVVACLVRGLREPVTGIYNLAGAGALTLRSVADRLGRPYLSLPAWLLTGALHLLRRLGLTQYGPEQVDFIRYRPVLSNRRLVEEFGYTPRKTSAEVLEFFLEHR